MNLPEMKSTVKETIIKCLVASRLEDIPQDISWNSRNGEVYMRSN